MDLAAVAVLGDHQGCFLQSGIGDAAAGLLETVQGFQLGVHPDPQQLVVKILRHNQRFAPAVQMDEIRIGQQGGRLLQGNDVQRMQGGVQGLAG